MKMNQQNLMVSLLLVVLWLNLCVFVYSGISEDVKPTSIARHVEHEMEVQHDTNKMSMPTPTPSLDVEGDFLPYSISPTPTPKRVFIATGHNPTPTPDPSIILAYVASWHPFDCNHTQFPGHAWVKVYSSFTNIPFNNIELGWWPINHNFFDDTGVWGYEGYFDVDTEKGTNCTFLDASAALNYMVSIHGEERYKILSYNCVHTSKEVFAYGYSGSIPSTASWWGLCYFIQTPYAWGQWLEANL